MTELYAAAAAKPVCKLTETTVSMRVFDYSGNPFVTCGAFP
jgi:hypothetical protein